MFEIVLISRNLDKIISADPAKPEANSQAGGGLRWCSVHRNGDHRHVIEWLAGVAELRHDRKRAFHQLGRGGTSEVPQGSMHPIHREQSALIVFGLSEPIGQHDQRGSRREPEQPGGLIGMVLDDSQRKATGGVEAFNRTGVVQEPATMASVGENQFLPGKVEDATKRRHEMPGTRLRENMLIGCCQDGSRVGMLMHQGADGAHGRCHDKSRSEPMTADVRNQGAQTAVRQSVKVKEISSRRICRNAVGGNLNTGNTCGDFGEQPLLNERSCVEVMFEGCQTTLFKRSFVAFDGVPHGPS